VELVCEAKNKIIEYSDTSTEPGVGQRRCHSMFTKLSVFMTLRCFRGKLLPRYVSTLFLLLRETNGALS
jgi:hypothetical protein